MRIGPIQKAFLKFLSRTPFVNNSLGVLAHMPFRPVRFLKCDLSTDILRIEDERNALLEAQRIEAARLEAEAAAAANSQSNIVSQIVAQIQPLVSQTVSSAVSGSRFPSGGRPVTRVRVPARIPAPQPVVQTSASSDLVNVFGQDGDFNVRLNHLGIEY